MTTFSLRQRSGTWATVVDVIVQAHANGTFYANVVTVLTDHEPTAAQAEAIAIDIMVDQVTNEDAWGRVLGASVRPLGPNGFLAEVGS